MVYTYHIYIDNYFLKKQSFYYHKRYHILDRQISIIFIYICESQGATFCFFLALILFPAPALPVLEVGMMSLDEGGLGGGFAY
jgi:hypothetical protein